MVQRRATIKIDSDVKKALAGMKQTSKSVRKTEEDTKRLNATWRKLGTQIEDGAESMSASAKAGLVLGVAAAAVAAANKIRELAKDSLRTQAVFSNLKFSLEGAAAASLGLVDDFTLAQSQVKALELGAISTEQQFRDLSEAGSILGLVMSGDASKGVDDLATALARGSVPILDNLGITLNHAQANEEFAKTLGVTVSSLTESQKAEAFRTVGLERAIEAARAKNIEDSVALDIARAEVIATNLRTEAIGGVVPVQAKLNTLFELMGDELNDLDIVNFGADLKKMRSALSDVDLVIGEDISLRELQNALIEQSTKNWKEEAAAIEARAEAQRKVGLGIVAAEARELNEEQLRHIEILQATGADQEFILLQQIEQLRVSQDLLFAESELATKEKERKTIFEGILGITNKIQLLELKVAKTRGDAAKRQAQAAKSRRESREKEIAELVTGAIEQQSNALRRNTEVLEARGLASQEAEERELAFAVATSTAEDRLQAIHQLDLFRLDQQREMGDFRAEQEDREIRRFEREIERREALGLGTQTLEQQLFEQQTQLALSRDEFDTAEELRHENELRRIDETQKAKERSFALNKKRIDEEKVLEAKRAAAITKATQITTRGLISATEAAFQATNRKGQAFAQEVSAFAGSRARILAIEAATHFALAAVSAIALNPVKAAAELAAGAKAAVAATALGALAAATGGIGGGAGGGGPGGFAGGGASTAGSTAGETGTAQNAPVSPLEQNGAPVPASNQPAGGTTTIVNVAGSFIDSGGQLQSLIDDASSNGGRKLRGGLG